MAIGRPDWFKGQAQTPAILRTGLTNFVNSSTSAEVAAGGTLVTNITAGSSERIFITMITANSQGWAQQTLEAKVGATRKFLWRFHGIHSMTSESGSGMMIDSGETWAFTFTNQDIFDQDIILHVVGVRQEIA